jgi:hypothetical protein
MRRSNCPAQFILGSPTSGLAPVDWMGGGGLPKIEEVTFCRQDCVPSTCLHLDIVSNFFMTTCDSFEDDPPSSKLCRRAVVGATRALLMAIAKMCVRKINMTITAGNTVRSCGSKSGRMHLDGFELSIPLKAKEIKKERDQKRRSNTSSCPAQLRHACKISKIYNQGEKKDDVYDAFSQASQALTNAAP